ncbi:mono/diheme cytochrome c family protein [Sphaerotilus hippei]|uniref:Mono/diheme cytochrome c family protein n=1 Tax=Sphaerotilus hippei TaxID=744406 RepID=A0A318H4R5_9BURK|nr:cytochrome c [Sphaerotilus hippei]PXW98812.1 mono/diheme cytochrome c family protein [Sphaerotilus hippei]
MTDLQWMRPVNVGLAAALALLGLEAGAQAPDDRLLQGRQAYEQHCSSCHAPPGQTSPEAPDLRRLDSFCRRLSEPALILRCRSDVDAYFVHSVREGKVRAGLVHMPPWKDRLDEATILAIRRYVETPAWSEVPGATPR